MTLATLFLSLLAAYLVCGLVFALPFAFYGVNRVDPHATHGTWGFRLMIIPGTLLLWPLLLRRWLCGLHEPPVERNTHRQAAQDCKPK